MGFAYVLRQTECDQHLVQLLVRPIRSLRPLLIPGTVLIGFVVNIPIISQAGTVVTIGPVLIPLLRAARLSPTTIGAAILLGASLGGELFNPGAVEWKTLTNELKVDAIDAIHLVTPYLLLHLAIATLLFWWLSARAEARLTREESMAPPGPAPEEEKPFRVNLLKAVVPVVPVVLLFLAGPPLRWLNVPRHWLIGTNVAEEALFGGRLIGAAMLLGAVVAAVVSPRKAANSARAFFEGAGYAFAQVISVIVVASCFGKAMEGIGVRDQFTGLVKDNPRILRPSALILPLLFAVLCGSGMASTQALFHLFMGPAEEAHVNKTMIGALVSLGSSAGRTISPVAPVVLICATLAGATPLDLIRRLLLPVLTGVAAVLIVHLLLAA
jgi:C4-dicarboxylate transporter, DcuC family